MPGFSGMVSILPDGIRNHGFTIKMRLWSRWILVGFILLAAAPLWSRAGELSAPRLRQAARGFELGTSGRQDLGRAYRLYCLAAALHDRRAMFRLGWLYFNGRGVRRDPRIALGWFRRAARRGDGYALRMVRRLRGLQPAADLRCPLSRDPKRFDRRRVVAWAKLLGAELGVDPRLVVAVIETESDFDPTALSPKLAYGLMQLMPETARRFGVNRLDPVENLIGGVLYLRWLLRQFRGDVGLALAAYNAGEAAVHRYRGIPPYRETRRYVHRILTAYRHRRHAIPRPLRF